MIPRMLCYSARSQILPDKFLTEGEMPLFLDQFEAASLVDATGGDQHIVGPQAPTCCSRCAREEDALVKGGA